MSSAHRQSADRALPVGVEDFHTGIPVRAAVLTALLAFLSAGSAVASCGTEPGPGVDWSECEKARLMIGAADLSGGIFVQTFLTSSDLRGANLSGADLTRADLSLASLAGANLNGANLEKAVATRADFSGTDMRNVRFVAAEIHRSNFQGANLGGADLTNSEMNRSDFTGADLTGTTMAKAELARIILTDATISGVSFSFSNLSRADLVGVNLGNADLTGTYTFLTQIGGADLSQTTGLTDFQLSIACGTEETKLPSGLAASPNWPCPDYDDDD